MLSKILKYKFCINWSANPNQVLSSVNSSAKTNPNFVKENAIYIIHHLSDLLDKNQWGKAYNFVKLVNLESINKWEIWEELAKNVKNNLEVVNRVQVESAIRFLYQVKYEPDQQEDKDFFKIIQNIVESVQINEISKFASYLLSHSPQVFEKYKDNLEQMLQQRINEVNTIDSLPANQRFSLLQGLLVDFWSQEFLEKIKTKIEPNSNVKKFFQLYNTQFPTKIYPIQQNIFIRTATQKKIGEMMRDLGYFFKENMMINGVQVDFLFGQDLILEYDGMYHYKINEGENYPKPRKYQLWRSKGLRKRNFTILRIPFYEWEKLENEKVQKIYLIEKIEKGMLKKLMKKQKISQLH